MDQSYELRLDEVFDTYACKTQKQCKLVVFAYTHYFDIHDRRGGSIFPQKIQLVDIISVVRGRRSPCAVVLWLRPGALGDRREQILINISGSGILDNLCIALRPIDLNPRPLLRDYIKEGMRALVRELKINAHRSGSKSQISLPDNCDEIDAAAGDTDNKDDDENAASATELVEAATTTTSAGAGDTDDKDDGENAESASETGDEDIANAPEHKPVAPSDVDELKRGREDAAVPDRLLESLQSCVDLVHQFKNSSGAIDREMEILRDEKRKLAEDLADEKARSDAADQDRVKRVKMEQDLTFLRAKETVLWEENETLRKYKTQSITEIVELRARAEASKTSLNDIKKIEASLRGDNTALRDLVGMCASFVDVEEYLNRVSSGEDAMSAWIAAIKNG